MPVKDPETTLPTVQTEPPGVPRWQTWFGRIAVAGAMVFAACLAWRPIRGNDVGYHLAYGDTFLDAGRIVDGDDFLYVHGNPSKLDVAPGNRPVPLPCSTGAYAGGDRGGKTTARQKLAAAVGQVQMFSFREARGLFEAAMTLASEGSAPWQQAIYGAAVCAHQISPPTEANIQRARRLYKQLIEKCPDSKYAPRATMNLGRIAELSDFNKDKPDLKLARQWYQKVLDRRPNGPLAGEAALRVAGTYIQTYDDKQVRQGVAVLRKFLARRPKDPLASAMWQYLGYTYLFPLKQYDQSLACYEKADALGLIGKGREGIVYWRMAVLADRFLKDRTRAVKYYTKIITRVPASGKGYEAQLALKRLGAPMPSLDIARSLKVSRPRATSSHKAATPKARP